MFVLHLQCSKKVPPIYIIDIMLTSSRDQLVSFAKKIIKENFSISEFASLAGVDYRNMCAFMAGRKEFPLKLAFFAFDYLGCKCVVFRNF